MIIHNIPFDASITDIISELKTELAINGINLFAKYFDSGDDVMVCCPYHKDGQERRPSAGIRKSDGLFHCLACDKTVGIDELIANCFGKADPLWGYQWLTKNFLTVRVEERKPLKLNFSRVPPRKEEIVYVSEEELDKYRYTHEYVHKRGVTDDIIELFDIGYDTETDEITFPVRDKTGGCLFVARRSVKGKRFDLPKDIEKPLYGLYEVGSDRCDKIYVCEGLFDCLRLWCNGMRAVAGFGCLFSDYQMRLLEALPTRHIVLALDNDKAGREANKRIRQRIKNKIVTEVILPQGKKDIGECTDEEINNMEEVFI